MAKQKLDFRDNPINMNERGGRKWIYAKKPSGKWFKRRTLFSAAMLLLFVGIPFIKVNGNPIMLLEIANRKFIFFGAIFWAQDTFILALLMLSFVLFVVLFTVTFGRLWCGWACPQTIFLEMIFRPIEHLIEGDHRQRQRLDNSPWNGEKIFKKTLKHGIFLIISVVMTNTFLMWFIGSDAWLKLIADPIGEHLSGFIIMLVISAFFYWVYSYFREQICTMVCPYGRMQGVLLDSKSIVVSYDYKRGEPRGKGEGDCTDCKQCLAVCPTGIDIRNGTQLECVNCTACIDACNRIMHVTGKPQGLIRYASEAQIKGTQTSIWTARNRAYSAVLLIIFSFFIYTLFSRPAIETTILRTPGLLYQQHDESISNVYNIKVVNKTHEEMPLELRILSHKGEISMAGNSMNIKDQDMFESTFVLFIPKNEIKGDKTSVEFGIFSNNELIETYTATFVGP
jgi:cytochrome c oxidase accessory protein FixG